MNLKEELRSRIPNIHFLRVMLSRYRVNQINSMLLRDDEIEACEKDAGKKHELVARHISNPSKDFSNIQKKADEAMALVGMEGEAAREDVLFCRLAYGFTPGEYISFGLDKKDMNERKSYVSDLVRIRFHCRMNDLADASMFNDKFRTYQFYREFYHREAIEIGKPDDFKVFQDYVRRHPRFVKKELFESLGNSVALVDMDTCGKTEQELFNALIARGKHILEEKIEQTEELSRVNASSVNTVRCITFKTREGIVVPYCILRMGRKGSFVDNGGAGGVIACVDYDTGRVITDIHDEKGGVFTAHPDSGTVLKGMQLPQWDQLRSICTAMALKSKTVKFIGWDMAHTPNGWVVVEGNAGCQMIGQQTILGGLRERMASIEQSMDLMA